MYTSVYIVREYYQVQVTVTLKETEIYYVRLPSRLFLSWQFNDLMIFEIIKNIILITNMGIVYKY